MAALLMAFTLLPAACMDGQNGAAPVDIEPLPASSSAQGQAQPGQLVLAPATAELSTLQLQQFSASIDGVAVTALLWQVDGVAGGNAELGFISATGLYTPPPRQASHVISAIGLQGLAHTASARVNVAPLAGMLTFHNDNARSGQNLAETQLTPATVGSVAFGKLFSLPVEGQVYAQPLLVDKVTVAGALHKLLIVATEQDVVYAFDADLPGAPLWRTSFVDPAHGVSPQPSADTGCADIQPDIGITSTPVVDPLSGTLYLVAKTLESGVAHYRLHALDLASGIERPGGAVDIQATVAGAGGLPVVFNPRIENQRLALLLSGGLIYFGTGSYCDIGDHHGWLLAYDAATLAQRAVFNSTPTGSEGGIWQSGGGAAADADGNVYVVTGNGSFDAASAGGRNHGNTVLKLAGGSLAVTDSFTPYNQQELADNDGDLGSAGALLLPDQPSGPAHLLLAAGKQGVLYLLDRDQLGGFQAGSDSQIVQSLPVGACANGACPVFSTPARFGQTLYLAAAGDALRAFRLADGQLAPSAQTRTTFAWPGATPVISAKGSAGALVWALQTNGSGAPAVLHAYAADDLGVELYTSQRNAGRDTPGTAVKFAVPTVAGGKVYVGVQDQVSVYGLQP